ncbi:hypothetical protein IV102_15065 [bacterium]|nr:hypothetical protein [bacterium]
MKIGSLQSAPLSPLSVRPTPGQASARPAEAAETALTDGVSLDNGPLENTRLRWQPVQNLVQPKAEQLARSAGSSWKQTASSGLADFASRYFSSDEFGALNSGIYHNFDHPLVVAEAAGGFAAGLGWSPERKEFIQQVALLHDADDRSQLGSDDVKTGSPARAQVTLEWMDQQQETLQQRFGWDSGQFLEAKALIARTDFPFDDKAKKPMGTKYDGQSPLQVYKELLQQLPQEKQAEVLRDGLALRFADQGGFYSGSFDMAVESVQGLASELQSVGVPTDLAGSLKFTPTFLSGVGKDIQLDQQLAQELGHSQSLPGREELLSNWDPAMAQRFRANSTQFELMGQALQSVPSAEVSNQLNSLKDSARFAYRLATGRIPT